MPFPLAVCYSHGFPLAQASFNPLKGTGVTFTGISRQLDLTLSELFCRFLRIVCFNSERCSRMALLCKLMVRVAWPSG